ncbi:MAG: hypothetical protein ACP5N9_00010 [Candidatus Bilamarchaeum sp.]
MDDMQNRESMGKLAPLFYELMQQMNQRLIPGDEAVWLLEQLVAGRLYNLCHPNDDPFEAVTPCFVDQTYSQKGVSPLVRPVILARGIEAKEDLQFIVKSKDRHFCDVHVAYYDEYLSEMKPLKTSSNLRSRYLSGFDNVWFSCWCVKDSINDLIERFLNATGIIGVTMLDSKTVRIHAATPKGTTGDGGVGYVDVLIKDTELLLELDERLLTNNAYLEESQKVFEHQWHLALSELAQIRFTGKIR